MPRAGLQHRPLLEWLAPDLVVLHKNDKAVRVDIADPRLISMNSSVSG